MYTHVRLAFSRVAGAVALALIVAVNSAPLWAQSSQQPAALEPPHYSSTVAADEPQEHDMKMARDGSGTAWLPEITPMYAIHSQRGPWQLMAHENVFVQYFHESSDRGDEQVGSINWVMGMAERKVGNGRVMFRGMFSAEPWTIGGCGYPDLLASGEECNGEKIHDRQHPHDLFMELAAAYDAPVKGSVRWQVYGGPVGEPALGPVAYPHRVSAMPNPLAPIAHHWLDSTHVSFGVITGGLYGDRWKAEASLFNGREPDEDRADFDFGALDSVSGRLWLMPGPRWAIQVSAGRLAEAEVYESGLARNDVTKVTASATYHRPIRENGFWASTIGWGRNEESAHGTNAFLVETSLTLRDRDTWFGRFEAAGKTAHDLALDESADDVAVAKLQGGYTRYLNAWHGLRPGVGISLSAGFVPERMVTVYGSRINAGLGVFVTVRPAAMMMPVGHGASQGADHSERAMVMVQTALDPAKLSCSPAIDPKQAASTTYEGKTYYFCSVKERDEFLTDPAMSLAMRPPKP